MRASLLIVLLAGCGALPVTKYCYGTEWASVGMESDAASCSQFSTRDALAGRLLVLSGIMTELELGTVKKQTNIIVRDVDKWEVLGTEYSGVTYLDGYTQVDADEYALAHEPIHTFEALHLILNTGEHPLWQEKGYYGVSNDFYRWTYSETCHVPSPSPTALQIVRLREAGFDIDSFLQTCTRGTPPTSPP